MQSRKSTSKGKYLQAKDHHGYTVFHLLKVQQTVFLYWIIHGTVTMRPDLKALSNKWLTLLIAIHRGHWTRGYISK